MKFYKKKIIIIIDGTNHLYKSYFTFKKFKNKKGQPIGAIYGMLIMLRKIFSEYKPKKVIVVFDHKKKNFRKKIYKKYKSNRIKIPEDLKNQIKKIIKIIKYMGITVLKIPGIEADDIIGTVAKYQSKKEKKILILTNDKDMTQLINSKIHILNHQNKIITKQEVIQKFGVKPKLIKYLLAISGDQSDNIPGIPGIGIKTAQKILENFKSLKEIYKNLKKLSLLNIRNAKNLPQIFKKNKKIAFISYTLSKIKLNIEPSLLKKKFKLKKPIIQKILDQFKKNNFTSLIKSFKKKNWFD
ncbi:5'-3' exonuclease [Buchnera aphidicola]|uniref:5'-3' exonuclease n=1 Tax=Buchnera aphidicola TaxID=9 RepID=UPI002237FF6C|nr:5'-3' exonuclease H3TH domain-containing protein [Buchnera aphidicola]MCW5197556.1 5'-3' exonuclease [Buchnera aphidicola (Chaitophorus viminalis)]